jgi:hypothetical protein
MKDFCQERMKESFLSCNLSFLQERKKDRLVLATATIDPGGSE